MSKTTSQKLAAEVAALVKSRNALLWIVTNEEGRVERSLIDVFTKADYPVYTWDVDQGIADALGKPAFGGNSVTDPGQALAAVRDNAVRSVWLLRDIPQPWLGDPTVLRRMRNLARTLPLAGKDGLRSMIVLTPRQEVPPELSDHAIVIKWQLPDRAEIAANLDMLLESLPPEVRANALPEGERDAAIEAAVGLSSEAAQAAYSKSLVTQGRRIVPAFVAAEKKRVVSGKGIEWFEPDPRGLDAVGGLEELKPWLGTRKLAFSQRARDFGLPPPKGMFLVGVPGCGKSLLAKAAATVFKCPLLRADIGAAQSKWVGESQANIRAVFQVAEAVGRCVLWIDEIEKALAGATQGAADGGVSSDALGTFLSWMQERKGEVFVIATANSVEQLPPELLRKGRFDEMWFVDLPTREERAAIVKVTLAKYGRKDAPVDVNAVVEATKNFTGAEIDALMPEALFTAFADGERQVRTDDLVAAARKTVPLAKTAGERIENLRKWAKDKARPASREEQLQAPGARNLDM